jgi:PTH1 family peptidyl-tRNA hydrolase
MYIIACLGNPGEKYANNRHNVGFRIANAIIKEFGFEKKGKKHKASFYEGKINEKRIFLIKPQTYMNLSGEAVQAVMSYYKIAADNLLVIYDDIDLEFEIIRIRKNGSAGTHNGMKSIIQTINSDKFPRIRIGIGPKPEGKDLADYVLSNFSQNEEQKLPEICNSVTEIIKVIFEENLDKAMNKFN